MCLSWQDYLQMLQEHEALREHKETRDETGVLSKGRPENLYQGWRDICEGKD